MSTQWVAFSKSKGIVIFSVKSKVVEKHKQKKNRLQFCSIYVYTYIFNAKKKKPR